MPSGFESRRWGSKKPVTVGVTGFSFQMVPPAGFEPAISTLKGWRPWPLDDGDSGKEYSRLFYLFAYRWQIEKPPHRSRLLFRFSNISICNIWGPKLALSVTDLDKRRSSCRKSQSVTVRRPNGLLVLQIETIRSPAVPGRPFVTCVTRLFRNGWETQWAGDAPSMPIQLTV